MNTCGACIRTRAKTGKSEELFPRILGGNQCGANTCRTCIRTRANTGKKSWRIILGIGFVPGGTQQY